MTTEAKTKTDETVTAEGVRQAARTLAGTAVRTPLIENEILNAETGGRILLKAEVLQHCGSFKFRGAYTRLARLKPEERKKGVVAWSSGNHGQGVARAAAAFGMDATIVMPADAPRLKTEKVKAFGAKIVPFDRYTEDREEIGREIADKTGAVLAPSYDHQDIIEGNGTVGLETLEDASLQGLALDAFLICCGGGGLSAGCATILADMSPETDVILAEPEGYDETTLSVKTGERHYADISRKSICDAIVTKTPGKLTLPILQRHVKDGVAVTDEETLAAMAFAYKYLKLVLEPGGAVALAALLTGKFAAKGKTVAVTLSGGNVDADVFARALAKA